MDNIAYIKGYLATPFWFHLFYIVSYLVVAVL